MRRRSFVRPPLVTAGVVKRTGDIGDSRAHTLTRVPPSCARRRLSRSLERTANGNRAACLRRRRATSCQTRRATRGKVHHTSALALARTPLFQSLCLSLFFFLSLSFSACPRPLFRYTQKGVAVFPFLSLSLSSLLFLRLARSHAHSRTDKKNVFSVPLSSRHNWSEVPAAARY